MSGRQTAVSCSHVEARKREGIALPGSVDEREVESEREPTHRSEQFLLLLKLFFI